MATPAVINPPAVLGGRVTAEQGLFGADLLTNTTDLTPGDWYRIDVLATATFANLTTTTVSLNGAAPTNLTALAVPATMTLLGKFTRINLTSGTVIAYRNKAF